jgi:hypothetical protein
MEDPVARFYDELAADHHLIFADWRSSVPWQAELPRVFDGPTGRRIVFQVWDWEPDGRAYTFHLFLVRQAGSRWRTTHQSARYRAVLRDELSAILYQAGFSEIRWLMPDESGYYQPIVLARRRSIAQPS